MSDEPLTGDQLRKIIELIQAVAACGHGSVTIRVVNGKARFIAVTYERKLEGVEIENESG